jgi:hypothetical protein
LIGLDSTSTIFAWVLHRDEIPRKCPSITITAPSSRQLTSRGRLDSALCPFDVLLPTVARLCHNGYDAEYRAANRAKRKRLLGA